MKNYKLSIAIAILLITSFLFALLCPALYIFVAIFVVVLIMIIKFETSIKNDKGYY